MTYDVDGLTMAGHLARPAGAGPWPAVLLGHDGVGLDDYQRGRADDLARHGYLAFALDYHGGRTFFGEPQAMLDRVLPLLGDPVRMLTIGRAALDVLLVEPGADTDRLGALGYGAGGRIVLELARTGVSFRALAAVHPGLPDPRAGDWAGTGATFLLCTGSADPICTPAQVLEFGGALQEAGVDWRAHIYGGAKHAFWAAPTRPDGSPAGGTEHHLPTVPGVGYHAAHAVRAWAAVLELFGESLAAPPGDAAAAP
ncbi:dienelactone hydrolase [Dactylosporangium matsuzakiense]|uniref:Dienelactone hydrolase n=2 Tax=Dactylosporangium matsuzakiense TaxID=53360 RepID=A0A9W6NJT4_9ACTN|nr:dienelactone hydrolase [Dactylosporangium matsuzakiense]